MAKLSLALAAFLMFLVATEATIRTTVIVDEDTSSSNPHRGGDCSEEMQRFDNLRNCREYMMEMMREGGGGHRGVLEMVAVNPEMQERCCQDLRQMDSQCTCQGLEMATREMMRQMAGEMEQQDMQTMWRMAEQLPGKCNASPSSCKFSGGRRQVPAWF